VLELPSALLRTWPVAHEPEGRQPRDASGWTLAVDGGAASGKLLVSDWPGSTYIALPVEKGQDDRERSTAGIDLLLTGSWCVSSAKHGDLAYPMGALTVWSKTGDTTSRGWDPVAHEWRLEDGIVGGDVVTGQDPNCERIAANLGLAFSDEHTVRAVAALASTCSRVLLRAVVEGPAVPADAHVASSSTIRLVPLIDLDAGPFHAGA